MTLGRPRDIGLPDAIVEAIAISYRVNHTTPLEEPVKSYNDFQTLHRFEVATIATRTLLSYHVSAARTHTETTLEYDAHDDRIYVVVSEPVYGDLALFRQRGSVKYVAAIANLLLQYLDADQLPPQLRPDRYRQMRHVIHPQVSALANAILVPLAGIGKVVTSRTLAPSEISRRWNVPADVAIERAAKWYSCGEQVVDAARRCQAPVTIRVAPQHQPDSLRLAPSGAQFNWRR